MNTIETAPELADVQAIAKDVHGWLTSAEGTVLYSLARGVAAGAGVIVEIGSWKGKSTIFLARGSLSGPRAPVFAIDPHTGSPEQRALYGQVGTFEEFQRNVARAGVTSIVRPLVATSRDAARTFAQPVALLFIDGAHDYESVRGDFQEWSPKVIDGGVIAFHDSRKPGPRRVIREAVCPSWQFSLVECTDSITLVRKTPRISPVGRLRNHFVFERFLLRKSSR